jgi:hypothetical protein
VVQGTQPSVFPRIPVGRSQNFPILTPLLPVKRPGLVCSGRWPPRLPWPGLLPHKGAVGLRKKVLPVLLPPPFLFLPTRPLLRPHICPLALPDRPFPLAVADRRSIISPDPSVADTSRGQGSQLVTQYHQPPRELIHINLGRPPAHTTASLHNSAF